MSVREIRTEIYLSGEKAFNDGMKAINSNLKTLQSDMRLVSSEFDGNANSIDALRAKQAVLQQQYDQQKVKVAALTEMLDKAKKAYGEDSLQVDKYKQQLNDAQVQQNKFGKELDNTSKYLNEAEKSSKGTATSINEFGKSVKDAGTKSKDFGDVVKVAMGNLAADAIKDGLKGLKERIGGVWDTLKNAPLDIVQGATQALVDMGKAVYEQTVASAAYADEILTMSTNTGISTDKLQEYNYMAELTDTSVETITGSMKKLTKNMDAARDGSKTASEAFKKLGVEIKNEDGSLRDNDEVFGEVIDKLGAMENETERDATAMEIFGKSAQDLNSFIAAGSDGIAAFAEEAHNVGAVLDEDTLTSLGAVDDALQRFKGTLEATKTAFGAEFAEPVESVLNGLTAIMQGEIDGGIEMLMTGIDQASEIVDQLFPVLEELLISLSEKLVESLPDLITAGCNLILSLIQGIAQTLPQIIPAMVQAIVTMVEALTSPDNLSMLITAGIDLMVQLALALAKAIPQLIPAVIQALETIVTTLWDNRGKIVDAGKELIKGLWEGIKDMGAWLWEKVSGFFGELVGGIKNFFGIHSPSTLFEDEIGKNLALGIGKGFTENMDKVNGDIADSIDTSFEIDPDVRLTGSTGKYSSVVSAADAAYPGAGEMIFNLILNGEAISSFIVDTIRREVRMA